MSSRIQSHIADFLHRRKLVDVDGYSLKAATALKTLSDPSKQQLISALEKVSTNLFRRHPGVRKSDVLGELSDQLLKHRGLLLTRSAPILPEKCQVLFLGANPLGTGLRYIDGNQLQIDEEARTIETKMREGDLRDRIEFVTKWAVRPDDLLKAVNELQPAIVHFSGHGSDADGIVLAASASAPHFVEGKALASVLSLFEPKPTLVVLNACYSSSQATALLSAVQCVIGMGDSVSDEAACIFSGAFYRAIAFGQSVATAFDQGKVALELKGTDESSVPELFVRKRIDARKVIICAREADGDI